MYIPSCWVDTFVIISQGKKNAVMKYICMSAIVTYSCMLALVSISVS